MFLDECRNRKRRRPGDLLHHIVATSEDTVLVVLSDFDKVLREERVKLIHLLHLLLEFLDGTWGVRDLYSKHLAHGSSNFGMVHLDRTVKVVDLTLMACRISQNVGDEASLGRSGNRGVAPAPKRKLDLLLGPNLLRKMRVNEPLSEKGGAKMGCRYA